MAFSSLILVVVALICLLVGIKLKASRKTAKTKSNTSREKAASIPWVDEDLKDGTDIPAEEKDTDEWQHIAHIPFSTERYSEEEMIKRSKDFYTLLNKRRSVRFISKKPIPREVIENVIKTAGILAFFCNYFNPPKEILCRAFKGVSNFSEEEISTCETSLF